MSRSRRLEDTFDSFAAWRAERDARAAARPPSLLDHLDDVTETAIASVTDHAGSEFRDHVLDIVQQVALERQWLTVDDISPRITLPCLDLRAIGGIMREAAKRHLIARVPGEYRPSTRQERHHSPVAVWESRIWEPNP